ncbi:hypothetical protein ABPG75_005537 [Micractinium tetrahymenae]
MQALSVRPAAAPVARRSSIAVRCQAQAPKPVPKAKQAAAAALAALAAVAMVVAPAQADEVKTRVCASNPTSKICLQNSGK